MAASAQDSSKTAATPAKPARARKAPTPKAAATPKVAKVKSVAAHAVTATKDAVSSVASEAKALKSSAAGKIASVAPAKPRPAGKPAARRAPAKPRKAAAGMGTGAVLGVAAAGIAAGLVANLGRKAAVQAPSVMAFDWLEALKGEHKAALALIDRLASTKPNQPAKRTLLLTQIRHALGKHAFTEENVIYPALREWGDKADADHLNHDQGYHKQFLYELDGMDKASAAFAGKVADFRTDLAAHIREEEDKIFPQLHAALSEEKNKTLTGLANREGFKAA